MKRKLLIGIVLLVLTSGIAGAGSLAYFSDVEFVKMTFNSGILDLEIDDVSGNMYNGEPMIWETAINWQPGDTDDLQVSLHMLDENGIGCKAESLICHFDVEVRDNYYNSEPEMAADPTGTINDLDSVITITDAEFWRMNAPPIKILVDLLAACDKNQDGVLKLSELDCCQWDLLNLPEVIAELTTHQGPENVALIPCETYYVKFYFEFDETADNEYQGDRIIVKLIITALQKKWEESSGVQEKPVEKGMLLVEKDPSDWSIVYDKSWGEVFYRDSRAMLLVLEDNGGILEPERWYLLTLQIGDWWAGSTMPAGGGIFGRKDNGGTPGTDFVEYIDIAMIKTDASGCANVIIPTVSGVTAADLNNPTTYNTDPTDILPAGPYTCAVVLKDVGPDIGGHPGWSGAAPHLLAPSDVLFETELISFTIS
jgi:predicted ribosomally synthesized peptide with SipW-like signal peptide